MTLESAVAHLATMEAQRVRALEAVRQVAEMHEQALAAYNDAAKLRDEALDQLIQDAEKYPAGSPVLVDALDLLEADRARIVKRPVTAADELLDLDDVGGH